MLLFVKLTDKIFLIIDSPTVNYTKHIHTPGLGCRWRQQVTVLRLNCLQMSMCLDTCRPLRGTDFWRRKHRRRRLLDMLIGTCRCQSAVFCPRVITQLSLITLKNKHVFKTLFARNTSVLVITAIFFSANA